MSENSAEGGGDVTRVYSPHCAQGVIHAGSLARADMIGAGHTKDEKQAAGQRDLLVTSFTGLSRDSGR